MSNSSPEDFPILFNKEWRITGLAEKISKIDRSDLIKECKKLRRCAPRRSSDYFVGHSGKIPKAVGSIPKPSERHLEIALWNLKGSWACPDGGRFRLLDYQFPLKDQQLDEGIGEVDLLGVTDQGRLIVIELKVKPKGVNKRGETPVAALMQGLRYAAIVEANQTVIAREAKEQAKRRFKVGIEIVEEPPVVQILAPKAWWRSCLELGASTRRKAGCWEPEFSILTRDVEEQLGVAVECVALDDCCADLVYGSDRRTPQLVSAPALYPVGTSIGKVLPPHLPECK